MNAPAPSPAASPAPAAKFDCRVAFAETLIELARTDPRIVAICNDSVGSSNLNAFRDAFPDRLINVGIAEQNMVGVAAGLANGGFVPFVCAAAPFLTGRATEQIKADVAYNGYHVVLCGMSPGMAYGELGPTHHSIEDLSWMRAITGLPIVVPADPEQTSAAVRWAVESGGPSYLRIGRTKVPSVSKADAFAIGRADVLRDGTDVTLIATGVMVSRALEAADDLAGKGISARVLNIATIRPLDEDAILAAARETGAIVTVEEAMVEGGLGAAVAAVVVRHHPVPMRILGVPGFAPTGSAEFLLEHFGLDRAGIVGAALELKG
ncbi:transketolase family protein [Methylobrevis pamukkalensis]|uniref:1-deoxy-D-xylulose-5-phosphate synthase n=1 Tax=Methylobrevis pamukkalensis TaxID=1439726 RepID=A0A1E3H4J4_9HYPH|nr:transketolase C-terminal domain-containing protein [Methylobrevis pamukkalensis]ODN70696.1 1-deoxy-D-xylulose-5-phosphate synthase [Methylobrevis pamukkalensis]